jgi:hypothetical protein
MIYFDWQGFTIVRNMIIEVYWIYVEGLWFADIDTTVYVIYILFQSMNQGPINRYKILFKFMSKKMKRFMEMNKTHTFYSKKYGKIIYFCVSTWLICSRSMHAGNIFHVWLSFFESKWILPLHGVTKTFQESHWRFCVRTGKLVVFYAFSYIFNAIPILILTLGVFTRDTYIQC